MIGPAEQGGILLDAETPSGRTRFVQRRSDSFVGEVCGSLKQGSAYGYTRLLGYHPILATRADTRESLHIRPRKGSANAQKGPALHG